MELLLIFAALLVCFSIMLTPSLSMQHQDQSSSRLEQGSSKVDEVQFYLPRKLRGGGGGGGVVAGEKPPIKGHGVQVFSTLNNKQKADFSGKLYDKEGKKTKRSRGTRQEWVEGTDTTQFYTMDYSQVRRRRPIHNKSLPVGP